MRNVEIKTIVIENRNSRDKKHVLHTRRLILCYFRNKVYSWEFALVYSSRQCTRLPPAPDVSHAFSFVFDITKPTHEMQNLKDLHTAVRYTVYIKYTKKKKSSTKRFSRLEYAAKY